MNRELKEVPHYEGGGAGNSKPAKVKKTNLLLIAFIAIALLTTLILISC